VKNGISEPAGDLHGQPDRQVGKYVVPAGAVVDRGLAVAARQPVVVGAYRF
jgi:hypothetical protein